MIKKKSTFNTCQTMLSTYLFFMSWTVVMWLLICFTFCEHFIMELWDILMSEQSSPLWRLGVAPVSVAPVVTWLMTKDSRKKPNVSSGPALRPLHSFIFFFIM